jgi:hypothetical protein
MVTEPADSWDNMEMIFSVSALLIPEQTPQSESKIQTLEFIDSPPGGRGRTVQLPFRR